jgi:hypothetical protein
MGSDETQSGNKMPESQPSPQVRGGTSEIKSCLLFSKGTGKPANASMARNVEDSM